MYLRSTSERLRFSLHFISCAVQSSFFPDTRS